jgi:hypothetical protein
MPVGASKLTQAGPLNRIREAIELSDTSPTWLRWKATWNAIRTNPGDPAGNVDKRTKYTQVTANGVAVHVKHAVWMLFNNQPIPEGMDVRHADGNASNFNPTNLELCEHKPFVRSGATATYKKYNVPSGCAITPHDNGAKPVYCVSIMLGRKEITLGAFKDPMDALAVLSLVASKSKLMAVAAPTRLDTYMAEHIKGVLSLCTDAVFDLDRPNYKERACIAAFEKDLRLAVALVQARLTAATTPRPPLHLKAVVPVAQSQREGVAAVSTSVDPGDYFEQRLAQAQVEAETGLPASVGQNQGPSVGELNALLGGGVA